MKFLLLDTVEVLNDHLEEGVLRGERGAIVEVYTQPNEAYEVEFVDDKGKTRVIMVLQPNELVKYTE